MLGDIEGGLQKRKEYSRWSAESARIRAKLGISMDYAGFTDLVAEGKATAAGVPNHARVHDILNCAWAVRQQKMPGAI